MKNDKIQISIKLNEAAGKRLKDVVEEVGKSIGREDDTVVVRFVGKGPAKDVRQKGRHKDPLETVLSVGDTFETTFADGLVVRAEVTGPAARKSDSEDHELKDLVDGILNDIKNANKSNCKTHKADACQCASKDKSESEAKDKDKKHDDKACCSSGKRRHSDGPHKWYGQHIAEPACGLDAFLDDVIETVMRLEDDDEEEDEDICDCRRACHCGIPVDAPVPHETIRQVSDDCDGVCLVVRISL